MLQFDWNGAFPKKRNWVLRNYEFKTDWVLFLDADEFVSAAFVREVRQAIQHRPHVGFWLNFENYFMGQRLKYGDPMRKLALFRVGVGEYEKIEEDHWSHLDMEVHEHPVLPGSAGEIKAPIEHNDFRGLKHYIAKHNEYSSWEAARYVRLRASSESEAAARSGGALRRVRVKVMSDAAARSESDPASLRYAGTRSESDPPSAIRHPPSPQSGSEWDGLTDRQKKKYRHLAKWWFAPAYFVVTYILKKGFLDGAVGFHFALHKAIYFYQIRVKVRE